MEQLCRRINMPEEMIRKLVDTHRTLPYFSCLDLLMRQETWNEGLDQLKESIGDDPSGIKRLCCMLRCAQNAKSDYERLGISETIYTDTMGAFSRFVREHMESYGSYGFDRGSWTPRQVSCKLFRIGQLEYELTALEGTPIVSLHIPTDVDLNPDVLQPSFKAGLAELYRLFPEYEGKPVYCHSWLMSPLLKNLLPENSNIIRFQGLFDIEPEGTPGNDVLLWVFKNPKLPREEYPEHTSLQRKLKQFFLNGEKFLDGTGYLRFPI